MLDSTPQSSISAKNIRTIFPLVREDCELSHIFSQTLRVSRRLSRGLAIRRRLVLAALLYHSAPALFGQEIVYSATDGWSNLSHLPDLCDSVLRYVVQNQPLTLRVAP